MAAGSVWTAARALLLVYDALMLSFVIQLGMALPMAVYFHRAMIVSMPANAIAVRIGRKAPQPTRPSSEGRDQRNGLAAGMQLVNTRALTPS